ncbi:MAG: DUF4286 family protein [Imperialibacter sp.]|jgi:hypothetical protein|uniref:DUF4286 family protein n=1 Tax=unclassified Imperialibacter TaxID=2629706 RepID=UPI00125AA087|nr:MULTISPECIES: DUF4286 family protein [unclassified Imperialibacter]CAD5246329.1 conserved hypothetical protein [Imperialibacter sp. 75]CAD5246359.1 conserved hypothetical protein [Imperialibacter sp. 89]VVS96117.1 conserved hypothetical protein [Imperialibacter sp. EC-SDR9]|tara:strand:+ start:17762 stop:18064 length:303 start_codon:yes stop_codon:yes gene_type:complete
MVLYNVTVNIESVVEDEWLHWIKSIHVPKVMATGMFVESKIFKLLHDEGDGSATYSVQFFAASVKQVNEYLETYAPALVQAHMERYKNKHVAFRTLMEEV